MSRIVYALADPTDSVVRYVGTTTKLKGRLANHKSWADSAGRALDPADGRGSVAAPVYPWLHEMFKRHGGPEVRVLPTDTHTSEAAWIAYGLRGLGFGSVRPGNLALGGQHSILVKIESKLDWR
jgi:hypothetical protein